jgi:VWFA-related protein
MIPAALRFIPVLVACAVALPQAQTSQRPGAVRTRDIYVSVLDNKGAPVTGLTPADFIVREDGVVREVTEARPADDPLEIALLIDDSQAASDGTSYLRDGLAAFVERLHGKGQIGLITIGERPTVLAPYSEDTEQLKQKINRIFPRTGAGAYLSDAIVDASQALAKREPKRGLIVAVTFEGVDYSNRHYTQVLEQLSKSGAALHVIAIGTPAPSLTDEMRSRNMVIAEGTARTGGRRDQVLALSGLPDKLKQAADELINQYVLTYSRPDTLIPPEKVEVRTTRRNVTARARTRFADR